MSLKALKSRDTCNHCHTVDSGPPVSQIPSHRIRVQCTNMKSINFIHHQCHYVTIAEQSVNFCQRLIHCQWAAGRCFWWQPSVPSHFLMNLMWWQSPLYCSSKPFLCHRAKKCFWQHSLMSLDNVFLEAASIQTYSKQVAQLSQRNRTVGCVSFGWV